MTLEQFVGHAIGLPFRPHGRTAAGLDCFGLVLLAYRQVLGRELPDYGGEYPRFKDHARLNEVVDNACGSDWHRVDDPLPMDAAVIYRAGRPIHIGLYLGGGRILHVEHGIDVAVQPVSGFRVEGFYHPVEDI